MILQALAELAEREGLTGDLDYQPMAVRWIVTIDAEGRMVGEIAPIQGQAAGGKRRAQFPLRDIPKRSDRSGQQIKAAFVIDKPEYVFGCYLASWVKEKSEEARIKTLEADQHRARHCGSVPR